MLEDKMAVSSSKAQIANASFYIVNLHSLTLRQWHNRWGGARGCRGQSSPWNFCWPTGKRGARKKGKMERKRRKIWKGRGGKLKMSSRSFFKLFFCFVLFVCFFFAFHFLKHWNLFGVNQNRKFLPGKNREKWFCPFWKIFLSRHCSEAAASSRSESWLALVPATWLYTCLSMSLSQCALYSYTDVLRWLNLILCQLYCTEEGKQTLYNRCSLKTLNLQTTHSSEQECNQWRTCRLETQKMS